jgi:hypothetical protein
MVVETEHGASSTAALLGATIHAASYKNMSERQTLRFLSSKTLKYGDNITFGENDGTSKHQDYHG